MTVDCQWVEQNLESLFCGQLNENESQLLRVHVNGCDSCHREIQAINAIDPLIKHHFRQELRKASQPRTVHKGRALAAGSALTLAAALSLVLLVRIPQATQIVNPAAAPQSESPLSIAGPPAPIKMDEPGEITRAKPSPEVSAMPDRRTETPVAVLSNAPDFLVTDPAGYTHTLDEYHGRLVVMGVWSPDDGESIAAIERLYKTYGTNPRLRFIGVSDRRQAKPADTTFPLAHNQGSKLFGAKSGEFVLVDENGNVELRGSLDRDMESLRRVLQEK
jgi:hypothetical protein